MDTRDISVSHKMAKHKEKTKSRTMTATSGDISASHKMTKHKEKIKSRMMTATSGSKRITFAIALSTLNQHNSLTSVTLQYCYRVRGKLKEIDVHFLLMTREGPQYTVTNKFTATISPCPHACRIVHCCETAEIDVEGQAQEYTFGAAVAIQDINTLSSPTKHNFQLFQVNITDQSGPQAGDTFTNEAGQIGNYHLILLARIISKYSYSMT